MLIYNFPLLLALCLLTASSVLVDAFAFSVPSSVYSSHISSRSASVRLVRPVLFEKSKSSVPEYVVEDDAEEDDDDTAEEQQVSLEEEPSLTSEPPVSQSPKSFDSDEAPSTSKVQYAALPPGTVVQIQVGDVSLARKAWKKRRRSGSPLLVPCSVLNVDRQSTIRWNLIYLLEKFGSSSANGIRISLSELAQRHRTHLRCTLTKHANALGHETATELVGALFNKKAQDSYGIKLQKAEDSLWLQAPLSRFKAQKRANAAPILQFGQDQQEDTLKHTGMVRIRLPERDEEGTLYRFQPLSAALRVSQQDVETGRIQDGSFHPAVVFDYDSVGDAGAPLLTLSLNPAANQVRDRLKISDRSHYRPILNPTYMLNDLKIGDSLEGKVVKLIKGGALVDCGVGRRLNSRSMPETVRVLAFLSFKEAVSVQTINDGMSGEVLIDSSDVVEDKEEEGWESILSIDDLETEDSDDLDETGDNDGDEVDVGSDDEAGLDLSVLEAEDDDDFTENEDITHLFEMNEDGSLVYKDPETGETQIIDTVDEEEIPEIELATEETRESKVSAGEKAITWSEQRYLASNKVSLPRRSPLRSKRLHVGDRVEVFVKSVSKQSSQLMVTMNPSVQGKKPKELKKESEVSKKLSRLAKQLGGLHRIRKLRGREMDGVVKATSNAGDWLYVEPSLDNLPVGVAIVSDGAAGEFTKGDSVRIQIEGIDEDRGQLAMRVLKKLSP